MTAIITQTPMAPRPITVSGRTVQFMQNSRSENTKRAYRVSCRDFKDFCDRQGVSALPATPATVADYLSDRASKHKPSTLTARLAAISVAHRAAGYDSPTQSEIVLTCSKGIRRQYGTAQRRVIPLRVKHLQGVCHNAGGDLRAVRDKALILVGHAGAFRRSELSALNIDDVEFCSEGLKITVRRSKTDQEGKGMVKAIMSGTHLETCPVRSLKSWIKAANITEGPLFRPINKGGNIQPNRLSGASIAAIVKRLAADVGLNPQEVSGHSLRSGFVTDAFSCGLSEPKIKEVSGHRTSTVLHSYFREQEIFSVNIQAKMGL